MSPQAPDDMRARWPGWDAEAIAFLEQRGWKRVRNWQWAPPTAGYIPSPREIDALDYLFLEWDWGGVVEDGDIKP